MRRAGIFSALEVRYLWGPFKKWDTLRRCARSSFRRELLCRPPEVQSELSNNEGLIFCQNTVSGNRTIKKSSYRDESHVVDSSRGTLSSSVFIFFIELLVVSLASSKVRVRFMAPKTATEKSTFIYKTFKKPPKILRPVSFVALHLLYPMMPSPFS